MIWDGMSSDGAAAPAPTPAIETTWRHVERDIFTKRETERKMKRKIASDKERSSDKERARATRKPREREREKETERNEFEGARCQKKRPACRCGVYKDRCKRASNQNEGNKRATFV